MRYIKSLRLTDFRSYTHLDLELDARPVVLFGANGAGKTNLLEAISFLSPGRGLRRAKLEDIVRRDSVRGDFGTPQAAWGVTARLEPIRADLLEIEPVKIGVGQVPGFAKRRLMRVNDENAKGAEVAQLMNLVWLTPAQDRLFTGPAADRRKFLDRFTLAHDPQHGSHSLRYEKARSERNRLLSDGVADPAWYRALELDLAHFGARIASARATTLCVLSTEIDKRPEGAFPKASLALVGRYEALALDGMSLDTLNQLIKTDLEDGRPLDMRAGRTLQGVHKTDLEVTYVPKNMPASECSTGEQKALLIGLTLAHCHAFNAQAPFLLLDEVAAHLDQGRRVALMEECLDLKTQVFMTGTDANLFEGFKDRAQYFKIQDSDVVPIAWENLIP